MKTAEELAKYLAELCIIHKDSMRNQPMFKMVATKNIVADFAKFADLQSGGWSNDPDDAASSFFPPIPDPKDGIFKHTVRDVTAETFHSLKPELGWEQFYAMPDALRNEFIEHFLDGGAYTSDKRVNATLGYCVWGSGSCRTERTLYKGWYKSDIASDVITLGSDVVLDRITDIRLYSLTLKKSYKKYGVGWRAGVLNFYQLLKQY